MNEDGGISFFDQNMRRSTSVRDISHWSNKLSRCQDFPVGDEASHVRTVCTISKIRGTGILRSVSIYNLALLTMNGIT